MVPLLHYIIVSLATYCEQGTTHINQVRSKSVVIYTENPPLSPLRQRERTNKGLSHQPRTTPSIPLSRLERDFSRAWPLQEASFFSLSNPGMKGRLAVRRMHQHQRTLIPPVSVWWETEWKAPFPQIFCSLSKYLWSINICQARG